MEITDPGRIELRVISPEARAAFATKIAVGVAVLLVAVVPIVLLTSTLAHTLLAAFVLVAVIFALLMLSHHRLLSRAPLRWILVGKDGQTTAFTPDGTIVGTTADATLRLHRVHYVLEFHSSRGTSTELRPAIIAVVHESALIAVCHSLRRPIAGPQITEPANCDLDRRTFMRLLELARTCEGRPDDDWRYTDERA